MDLFVQAQTQNPPKTHPLHCLTLNNTHQEQQLQLHQESSVVIMSNNNNPIAQFHQEEDQKTKTGSSHDRPQGLTPTKYFIGFFSTVGAGLLFALYLPVMERIYKNVHCYGMVMEMQLVMEIAATALATAGMATDGGFREMKRESKNEFDKGVKWYWMTVIGNVVTWQLCFMGTAGMVFLTSSLTGGICMTALLGMNVVGGVLVYGDEFGGVKVVSTLLCVWGFCSYVYGMYLKMKDQKELREKEEKNLGMEIAHVVAANNSV
ncbi:hypothetical protein GH714_035381 [Hevea brasiliensis]|uniref:Purine permease 4 n=1 Tax=Hevea brasiliensis TaxID=3981 RepID=A0A6A6LUG3_HEVBR|nr:hypothetical protein GH714_035381 [Hevea brasiliensis]